MGKLLVLMAGAALAASAQDVPRTSGGTTENPPVNQPRTERRAGDIGAQPGGRQRLDQPPGGTLPATHGVSVAARLLDPARNGREKAAVVQVTVKGLQLVDPDQAGRKAKQGQGHLLYRLDGGPIVSTTATKLGFRELNSGSHKLDITLAGNDNTDLGPHEIVDIKIP